MRYIKCLDCGNKIKNENLEGRTCEQCNSLILSQKKGEFYAKESIELDLYKLKVFSKIFLGLFLTLFTTTISIIIAFIIESINLNYIYFCLLELFLIFYILLKMGNLLYKSKFNYKRIKDFKIEEGKIIHNKQIETFDIDQLNFTKEELVLKFRLTIIIIVYSLFLFLPMILLYNSEGILTMFGFSLIIIIVPCWILNLLNRRRIAFEFKWDKRNIRFYVKSKINLRNLTSEKRRLLLDSIEL